MPDITISLTAGNITRLQAALQETQGLDNPATEQEVKDYIIIDLKQLVRSSERRVAVKAANPNPDDIEVT